MGKITGPSYEHSDTEEDRILNAYYCGQILALHHLIYYLWRAKRKYNVKAIHRFIESRYCYLIEQYPNFYNQIIKNDRELASSGETEHTYHKLFEAMQRHYKDVVQKEPKE